MPVFVLPIVFIVMINKNVHVFIAEYLFAIFEKKNSSNETKEVSREEKQ